MFLSSGHKSFRGISRNEIFIKEWDSKFFVPKTVGDTVCLGISVGFLLVFFLWVTRQQPAEFSLVSFMVKNVINHWRKKVKKSRHRSVKEVVLVELPNNNQAVQKEFTRECKHSMKCKDFSEGLKNQ